MMSRVLDLMLASGLRILKTNDDDHSELVHRYPAKGGLHIDERWVYRSE